MATESSKTPPPPPSPSKAPEEPTEPSTVQATVGDKEPKVVPLTEVAEGEAVEAEPKLSPEGVPYQ